MKPKQKEMDSILEKIYDSFTKKKGERTLMVVCGDHGMNDAGNHGGSSAGETSTV
jgi:ethanolamine phosphate transferase 2 subunit G